MTHLRNSIYLLLVVALIAAPLAFLPKAVAAQAGYTCLPTCENTDARFLSVAGTGLATVADQPINMTIAAAADSTSVEIGVFDGNTGGMWDLGSTQVQFTLYADRLLTGDTSTIVAQALGTTMPDNDWFTFTTPNVPEALSPSGNYFYRLQVGPVTLGQSYWSNFKVRSNAVILLTAQPFSYLPPILTVADRATIYPNYPDLSVTTYDGRFDFHIYVPSSVPSVTLWDGDFDFGSHDLVDSDTDDFNTPNDVKVPWADPLSTNFEGVAVGFEGSTGDPSDDSSSATLRRSPSVVYDVILPGGTTYTNLNASGNLEWEKFLLASDAALQPDFQIAGRIPSGLYNIHGRGVDISNLNAWRFPYEVVGVCEVVVPGDDADPCRPPLYPFLIGDTVFRDTDGDGTQDTGEAGIPGVVVYLLDSSGLQINDITGNPIFAVTDANGNYTFNVPGLTVDPYTGEVVLDGTYTVRVGAENFNTGGALAGMTSTTGGEELTRTVTNDNVLTYDFGYNLPKPPACVVTPGIWKTVWKDRWPVQSITIAGVTYTREQAIKLMSKPAKKDMTYQLFSQVVAAKLNVLNGNESQCIDAAIEAAETWLMAHPLGSKVALNSKAWKAIMFTFKELDSYNKGKLCAGACTVTPEPPKPPAPKPPKEQKPPKIGKADLR